MDKNKNAENFNMEKDVKRKNLDYETIMKKYHLAVDTKNDELKSEAAGEMIELLDGFSKFVLFKRYPSYAIPKYIDDILSCERLAILEALPNYDTAKGKPTTFFYLPLIHAIQGFIDSMVNNTSTHYGMNITKIKKVMRRYESCGKDCTIQDIRNETGLKEETIRKCLDSINAQNELYYTSESLLDSILGDKYSTASPEEAYLIKERNEALYEALASLSRKERTVLIYRYGLSEEKPLSYRDIAEHCSISIEDVKRTVKHAQAKLQNDRKLNTVFKSNLTNHINKNNIPLNSFNDADLMLKGLDMMHVTDHNSDDDDDDFDDEIFFSF